MINHFKKVVLFVGLTAAILSCKKENPQALFTVYGNRYKDTAITFMNKSVGATRYEWDFGDGIKSKSAFPKHSFNKGGTYTIKLKAIRNFESNEYATTIIIEDMQLLLEKLQKLKVVTGTYKFSGTKTSDQSSNRSIYGIKDSLFSVSVIDSTLFFAPSGGIKINWEKSTESSYVFYYSWNSTYPFAGGKSEFIFNTLDNSATYNASDFFGEVYPYRSNSMNLTGKKL